MMRQATIGADVSPRAALKRRIPRWVVTNRLRPGSPSVLLTFDDGPDASVTPAVLDRLDAAGAKAVFFVVGNRVDRAPGILERVLARGHAVGNHSYSHPEHFTRPSGRRPGLRECLTEVRRCQDAVTVQCGQVPRLFRPPGGRLTAVTVATPLLLGLRCVTWSREVADWSVRDSEDARKRGSRLAADTQPGDIILLHDDNPFVLDLLDVLLPALLTRGFDLSGGLSAL